MGIDSMIFRTMSVQWSANGIAMAKHNMFDHLSRLCRFYFQLTIVNAEIDLLHRARMLRRKAAYHETQKVSHWLRQNQRPLQ